jgi:hypothetical protein
MVQPLRGDIFRSPAGPVSFDRAFPEIESIDVIVEESGEGNAGLGRRHFTKRSVREIINCSSAHCGGQGFLLGDLLREMVASRTTEAHRTGNCQSREESGRPCTNAFDVKVRISYRQIDPRDALSPWGVLAFLAWDHPWNDHHFPPAAIARGAAAMKDAGIGMVRMDFLWADIEPSPGVFQFDRYDDIVRIVRAAGVQVLAVLHYNPTWRPGPWNQAPEPDRYVRYIRAVVSHFKDRIRSWEVWNEPDHPNYWQPQDGLAAYAALLKQSYASIKEEDPTSRVLVGGLSQQIPENLRRLYELGTGPYFDVANIHPFMTPLGDFALGHVKNICSQVRDMMEIAGDGSKPLWVTEIGCPGVRGAAIKNWWLGKNPTEEQQAQWLTQVYQSLLSDGGVDKIFWAFLRDTPAHFKDGVDFFGLLREDFTPKPAYHAYRRLARGES